MVNMVIGDIGSEPIQNCRHLQERGSRKGATEITPIAFIARVRIWEIMLDEKDSDHYRCTAAHHHCVKDPEVRVANGASDPPPQQAHDRCIGDHVDTFSTGIEEA